MTIVNHCQLVARPHAAVSGQMPPPTRRRDSAPAGMRSRMIGAGHDWTQGQDCGSARPARLLLTGPGPDCPAQVGCVMCGGQLRPFVTWRPV